MGSSRWLLVVLIASLAVNLALAGFVVGRLSGPDGLAPASLDPSLGMFRVLRELPEARREALGPPLRDHFRGLRGELRRMREAQRQINDALAAEPFDADALTAALGGFRAALLDSQQANHALLVRMARAMTAEERALLIDAMTRGRPHGRRSDQREGSPPR
ncbi:MAG: periplasmic heavy metal sensor [Pseudomonadales bacterium]